MFWPIGGRGGGGGGINGLMVYGDISWGEVCLIPVSRTAPWKIIKERNLAVISRTISDI